jgi:hypothetical protein
MSQSTQRSYEDVLRAEQLRCDQRAAALAGLIARELERAEEIERLLEHTSSRDDVQVNA